VARYRWLSIAYLLCLVLGGCNNKRPAKKPDPTKGAVTGIVLCADTGKPARFATVILSKVSQKDEKAEKGAPLPATETTMTDLEGRFQLEAVEPGHYYAFATLEGYLDPVRGLDIGRIDALEGDREQELEAVREWKEHLVDLSVHVHRTSEVTLQIERGAEINGMVVFDDGSPAIGMHFEVVRKTEKGGWSDVGFALFAEWAVPATSDGHGRFSLTNLTAGEYAVCSMIPGGTQDSAARVCLGNTLRIKDAATVKVKTGEVLNGVDIVVPLSGLHTVEGSVTALADGHGIARGKALLLYADDREKARESALAEDGSFSFEYVPEGKFIVQVAGAADAEERVPGEGVRQYKNNETPVTVLDDVDDISITLSESVKPSVAGSSTNPVP
jgi:hypothetical protein